jgi:hypothetical protein
MAVNLKSVKPRKTNLETNYDKLDALLKHVGKGGVEEYLKLDYEEAHMSIKNPPYMDLCIEKVGDKTISLTHYYEQNGDLVANPDMTVRFFEYPEVNFKGVEALTYQDQFGYQQVYPEPGKVYPRVKKQLNAFLCTWLNNLKKQGFYK